MVGRCCCLRLASITFIMRVGFSTSTLAYMLDSLVRVSRRVSKNHFGKIAQGSSGNTPTSTNKLLETKSDLQSFCGCETSFCLTTENPIIASPGETNSLWSAIRFQWLDKYHRSQPKNKFLLLPSQRFQVFWLSFQSSFHLSFTVLVRYRFPIYI